MDLPIDKHEFYYEASKRLLKNLKIEKAIHSCLLYIRNYIPADHFALHFFNPGLGIIETLVDASIDSSELMSQITTLSPEARDMIQQATVALKEPECVIFDQACDNEMARQLSLDLKTPDCPCLALDLVLEEVFLGFVSITNINGQKYNLTHADLVKMLHDPLAMACSQFKRFQDISRLKEVIYDNARQLQNDLIQDISEEIVGADFGLKDVMDLVNQVAALNNSVLLLGETGTGKEVIATALHRLSPRGEGPFIKVNCGAIPPGLIESELFGHEKGAFSGAITQRRGCFERANGGTLLLDEISELTLEAQVRLLRVLQDKTVERIGGSKPIRVDTRIVAATNRDLESMVTRGEFRQDLLYRLNVFPIHIPPLRERSCDIPALTHYFIKKKSLEIGLSEIPSIKPGAVDQLLDYHWPSNVREIANIVEWEIIIHPKGPLTFSKFKAKTGNSLDRESDSETLLISMDQMMVRHITTVLKRTK